MPQTFEVLVPVTGLSFEYRQIIRDMVRSKKGLHVKCERPEGKVNIRLARVAFHRKDNTATVVFDKQGFLDDENEEAIIKERIRELFDVRYY